MILWLLRLIDLLAHCKIGEGKVSWCSYDTMIYEAVSCKMCYQGHTTLPNTRFRVSVFLTPTLLRLNFVNENT